MRPPRKAGGCLLLAGAMLCYVFGIVAWVSLASCGERTREQAVSAATGKELSEGIIRTDSLDVAHTLAEGTYALFDGIHQTTDPAARPLVEAEEAMRNPERATGIATAQASRTKRTKSWLGTLAGLTNWILGIAAVVGTGGAGALALKARALGQALVGSIQASGPATVCQSGSAVREHMKAAAKAGKVPMSMRELESAQNPRSPEPVPGVGRKEVVADGEAEA